MKLVSLFACLFLFLCSSCNEIDPKGEKEVRAFVQQWNENHTQLKAPFLKPNYMDVVNYYGTDHTKEEVLQDKLLLFQQFPDYTQQLDTNQVRITKEAGNYLVVFTNQVQYNGVDAAYEWYVSLVLKNGGYKIVSEGIAEDAKHKDAPIFPDYRETTMVIPRNRQLFGDFNGDALSDYAFVTSPELVAGTQKSKQATAKALCKGGCSSIINFSAPGLQSITIEDAYQSQLENLKDLNGDGADEIGFWNIQPTTKSLYVFDATTSKLLTPPIVINTAVHKNLNLIDVFKKSGANKITVTRSVERDGKWVLVSEIVGLE
ncbi:hypothetical protein [Rasiella sp. SM2506]|uniref:hypothetical protein n=1 Tax=Rasiella sp. SM2506 TaxID=3423914 RepID=UPI003D7B72A2